jgi:alkylation response protein AidB-like acyl-CoA dehydrogenase
LQVEAGGGGAAREAADEAPLAFHASGAAAVSLTSAEVIGTWPLAPGGGLQVRGRARLWAAAVSLGVARAALASTLAYTTERVVFGKPVAHHQGNAFDLAAMAARVHAARLCVRDAAARFDGNDPDAGFWATTAWVETTETAIAVTDLGIQLLGGHGFLMDHLAEKRFREARMLGLLFGGRDGAVADLASAVIELADPILPGGDS